MPGAPQLVRDRSTSGHLPSASRCELVSESLLVRTLASEYRSQSYAVEPRLHRRYFYIGPLTSSRVEDVNVSLGTTIQPPHRLTWDPQKLVVERNLTPGSITF